MHFAQKQRALEEEEDEFANLDPGSQIKEDPNRAFGGELDAMIHYQFQSLDLAAIHFQIPPSGSSSENKGPPEKAEKTSVIKSEEKLEEGQEEKADKQNKNAATTTENTTTGAAASEQEEMQPLRDPVSGQVISDASALRGGRVLSGGALYLLCYATNAVSIFSY